MKKNVSLILSTIAFALNFLCFWYADILIGRYFVFGLIPIVFSLLFLVVSLVLSVISAVRHHTERIRDIPLVISVLTIVMLLVFPFRSARVHAELRLYEKDRLKVIEMIKTDQIPTDHLGNATLPKGYGRISSDGQVFIYQNDEEQVISFWVFRGMLSGSVQVIYSSGDESLIYENEAGHPITNIQKLKEHWYLVDTDY